MSARIPTDLWVTAHMRDCATRGIPVTVVHKGAFASGTVMVKIFMQGRCKLLNQSRDIDGETIWMDIYDGEDVEEKRVDEYIGRAVQRDPDVWVIEVEDPTGKNPFEGKIV